MAESSALPVLPLAGKRHIILAVSGGSDSTALLHLAAQQRSKLANPPEISAVTVDHRLRSGSTAEARAVESMCATLGIRHTKLAWEGDKPASGIQGAARNARRKLLAAAAGKASADAVFTGHTLDDQLETVAMRQLRGSGHGLAGIAPVSFVFNDEGAGEPVPFMRPLLGTTRSDLRRYLTTIGVEWIDDPSNENVAFERVAIRKELAASGQQRFTGLAALQQRFAKERILLAPQVAGIIKSNAFCTAPGLTRVDHAIAKDKAHTDTVLALRVLLAFASGTPGLAEESHAGSMLSAAGAYADARSRSARYGRGGVLTDFRKQGMYLLQEQRRGTMYSAPFAGRYRATGLEPGEKPPLAHADPVAAPASLIRKAAAAEPIFDCPNSGATSCIAAFRAGRRLRLLINPWPDLVPSFDLAPYNALSEIAGVPPIDLPLL